MITVSVALCEGGKAFLHKAGIALRNDMLSSVVPSLCEDDFCTLTHGKPALVSREVGFSVSHSGSAVCCAVAANKSASDIDGATSFSLPVDCGGEVGIDIELIRERPLSRRRGIAKRFFSEQERAFAGDDLIRFYEIHTKKEALCKLSGLGLAAYRDCSLSRTDAETHTMTLSLGDEQYVLSIAFYVQCGKNT